VLAQFTWPYGGACRGDALRACAGPRPRRATHRVAPTLPAGRVQLATNHVRFRVAPGHGGAVPLRNSADRVPRGHHWHCSSTVATVSPAVESKSSTPMAVTIFEPLNELAGLAQKFVSGAPVT